jgi:hypothetical protein
MLPATHKAIYVRGVYDAFRLADLMNKCATMYKDSSMPGASYLEVAKALDSFYSDSLNARIPVIDVLRLVKNKSDGASAEQLDTQAAALRIPSQSPNPEFLMYAHRA